MKITVDVNDMKQAFENMNRDYYSWDGLQALLDYYDEVDENIELDVIAICCECTEYGEHGAVCTFQNMEDDFSYLFSREEWAAGFYEDDLNDMDEDEKTESYIKELVEELERHTTVLQVSNGNYIVFEF